MRNRYLDLLRAVAVARVVVYHAAGWGALSIVFPAMAVMFALAGSLMAASIDRYGVRALIRRLRRLLPPLWILAAVFVPAMLFTTGMDVTWRVVLWALPLQDPPANGWGSTVLSVIWYLRDYLWFVLVSPLALPLFRRLPLPTVLAPLALLVAVEAGVLVVDKVLADFALYFACWLLGFAHHDGMLRRMRRLVLFGLAGTAAGVALAWYLTHPGPEKYDLNYIRLADGFWSVAFVLVLLGLAPATAAWVDRVGRLGRVVTVLNSRAVTIYLWHLPVVVGTAYVLGRVGLLSDDPVGIALRLVIVATGVSLVVAVFGWVEDVAARRRPALLPGRRRGVPTAPAQTRPQTRLAPADARA